MINFTVVDMCVSCTSNPPNPALQTTRKHHALEETFKFASVYISTTPPKRIQKLPPTHDAPAPVGEQNLVGQMYSAGYIKLKFFFFWYIFVLRKTTWFNPVLLSLYNLSCTHCDVISTQQRFFASLVIDGVNFPFISLMLSVTPCTNTSISSFDQLGFLFAILSILGGQTTKRYKHGNTYRACAYETKVSCQESFLS